MKKNYIQPKTTEAASFMGPIMELTVSKWAVDGDKNPIIEDDPDDIDIKPRESADYLEQPERMSLW